MGRPVIITVGNLHYSGNLRYSSQKALPIPYSFFRGWHCFYGCFLKRAVQEINSITFLLWAQGGYFALTGIWPLLHYASFEKITGRKTDVWLVKTVGALLALIGILLIAAALNKDISIFVVMAAMGSAAILLLVDVVYVVRRVIRPVYLADGIAEFMLLSLWTIWLVV